MPFAFDIRYISLSKAEGTKIGSRIRDSEERGGVNTDLLGFDRAYSNHEIASCYGHASLYSLTKISIAWKLGRYTTTIIKTMDEEDYIYSVRERGKDCRELRSSERHEGV